MARLAGRAPCRLAIEFLGLPGAGKSTMSHRIAAMLQRRGTPVAEPSYLLAHGPSPRQRRLRKIGHVLREILLHPRAAVRACRAIAGTQQRDLRTRLLLLANWLLVAGLARRAHRDGGIHMFDQGLLQAIWSIALEDRDERALGLLDDPLRAAMLPDVVVVLDADLDTVRRRLGARGAMDSRVERHPTASERLLRRGQFLIGALQRALVSRHDVRIITTPCDEPDVERLTQWFATELGCAAPEAPAGEAAPA